MQKVILTVGLSGCGKTYFSINHKKENPEFEIVCKDDIRLELNQKWSKELEKQVIQIRDDKIREHLNNGKSVIVADTNLAEKHIHQVQAICNNYNITVDIKSFLDVPIETCIIRDALRDNPVGESVIRKQYKSLVMPKLKKESMQRVVNACNNYNALPQEQPKYIICDIDGTIALMTSRGAFEWHKVGTDEVIPFTVDMLRAFRQGMKYKVILVSGRDEICREQTERWLHDNNIEHECLFMREQNDMRCDTIVKKEIYNTYIKDKFNIAFVIDDRKKVVEMWRNELGLFVFNVDQSGLDF